MLGGATMRTWSAVTMLTASLALTNIADAFPVGGGKYFQNDAGLLMRRDSSSTSSASTASSSSTAECGFYAGNKTCSSDLPACNGIITTSDNGVTVPTCGKDSVYTGPRCIPFWSADASSTCQNLPVCSNFSNDFTGSQNISTDDWAIEAGGSYLTPSDDGLALIMDSTLTGVTLRSMNTMVYGKVTTVMRPGSAVGIVSAHVLMSASGDEIDWEYPGTKPLELNWWSQANMIANPNQSTGVNNDNQFHTYVLDWTPSSVTWSIDGNEVWSADGSECTDCVLPQTPAYVYFSYWAGDASWTGGDPDFSSQSQYNMTIQSVTVECYNGTDTNISGSGNEYQWTSNSTASPKAGGGNTVSVAGFKIVEGDDSTLSVSGTAATATGSGSSATGSSTTESNAKSSSSGAMMNIPAFSIATVLSIAFATVTMGWQV